MFTNASEQQRMTQNTALTTNGVNAVTKISGPSQI